MHVGTKPDGLLERVGLAAGLAPTPMFESHIALITARAIMAGTSLGVFEALAEQPGDASELAERLELDPHGVDVLLTALRALGYVRDAGGRYENTRVTERWLLRDAKRSLPRWVGGFSYDLWELLRSFEDVVRGADAAGYGPWDADDPRWERYMGATLEGAQLTGAAFARMVPAGEDPQRLLDLGGGAAAFSLAMCRRHDRLKATVVDFEGAARIGRRAAAEQGMEKRVGYVVGDLFETELGCGYDVAMANSVLHMLPPERCRELLRRAHGTLREDGTMAVLELERGTAPLPDLFGLVFYAAERTRTYTAEELRGWFEEAGFRKVRARRSHLLPGSVVVIGRK